MRADLVVLGGLNEGSWPAETRTDPFLNRAMRRDVGLEAPERFIGLAAHDVASLMARPRVVVTRALKRGGEPTVASRWLQRLAALAGGAAFRGLVTAGARYCDWARRIDAAPFAGVPAEPAPRPPLDLRPGRLRVSEIERLVRDPYAIYARRILRLEPLEPLEATPDAATRGTIIHQALNAWLDDPGGGQSLESLLAAGERAFVRLDDFPEVRAIWWPRFVRIAAWFVHEDAARRDDFALRRGEVDGALALEIAGRRIELVGRADRIDVAPCGRLRILDYKTGAAPTQPQILSGLSPQLPLEAVMARAGAFGGIAAGGVVAELAHVCLTGRRPAGAWCPVKPGKGTTLDDVIDETAAGLNRLLAGFGDPDMPYRSKIGVQQRSGAGDYDHLSRFAEWSTAEEGDGE